MKLACAFLALVASLAVLGPVAKCGPIELSELGAFADSLEEFRGTLGHECEGADGGCVSRPKDGGGSGSGGSGGGGGGGGVDTSDWSGVIKPKRGC